MTRSKLTSRIDNKPLKGVIWLLLGVFATRFSAQLWNWSLHFIVQRSQRWRTQTLAPGTVKYALLLVWVNGLPIVFQMTSAWVILSRQITSTTSLQVYALNYLLLISRLARPTYLPEDHHPTFNASGSFKRWRSLILLKLSILKILLFDWSKNSPWRSLLRYLPSSILFWSRVLSHRVGNVPL